MTIVFAVIKPVLHASATRLCMHRPCICPQMHSDCLQAVTEFHVLLLYPTRLLALNAVSHASVQDIALAGRGAPGYAGQPLALATDPSTAGIYLYTSALPDPSGVPSV